MATIFKLPRAKHVDSTGTPFAGAKANFFITGTSTPTNTYSDSALTSANANPVVADSAGLFGIIYLDPSVIYKLTLAESDDTLIYTEDPVSESVNVIGNTIITKSSTYTTVVADNGKVIECTGTFTLTLLPAATAAAGFTQIITNIGTGVITVDGNASETINSYTTLVLGINESVFIATDGSNWSGTFSTSAYNNVEAITGSETVAIGDRGRVYNVTSGTFSITLLAAATAKEGFFFTVINQGSGVVTLDGNLSETINGATTLALGSSTPGTSATLICDGTNWVAHIVTLASATLEGMVELLTDAETRTGSDTTRAMTTNNLNNTIFSLTATINQAGASSAINETNAGATGWSIADGNQAGEAIITHTLGLASVDDLHIVMTVDAGTDPGSLDTSVVIEDAGVNSFQVQVQTAGSGSDAESINMIAFYTTN